MPTRDRLPPNVADVVVLVDFDNVVPGAIPDETRIGSLLDRIVALALDRWPDSSHIEILLYGGWLQDGVLTRRASELQASIASARFFPFAHPQRQGLLRGNVALATRLSSVPELEWAHTLRERQGMPRVRFRDGGYPLACLHRSNTCPLRTIRKFSRAHDEMCHATGCSVTNGGAFRAPEQKMVDVMIACDVIDRAMSGLRVLVLSSDLDVLPAIAMASKLPRGEVAVLRVDRHSADLYDHELANLGVHVGAWEGA